MQTCDNVPVLYVVRYLDPDEEVFKYRLQDADGKVLSDDFDTQEEAVSAAFRMGCQVDVSRGRRTLADPELLPSLTQLVLEELVARHLPELAAAVADEDFTRALQCAA